MLRRLGGTPQASDCPSAGLTAAQIVDVLHGGDGYVEPVRALVPLGRSLAEMTAFFGGRPADESAPAAAAELLRTLRRDPDEAPLDGERYLGDVLFDVLEALPRRRA